MTAVFPLTWQAFRLGLHTCPIERKGLATLRHTLSFSNLSKQHFRSVHESTRWSPVFYDARPKISFHAPLPLLTGQARCASLWQSKPEEKPSRQNIDQPGILRSRGEINAILGLKVGRKDGNALLDRLQEQRHQGTLDRKLPYPDTLIKKGLKYLRAKYPLDEDAAIIARIDKEMDVDFRLPQTNIDKSPHAVSSFEELVRENRARLELKKAKQETRSQSGVAEENPKVEKRVTLRDGTALVQLRPEPEWVRRYRDEAEMKELPEMSMLARLLPSGLLTVAVIVVAVLFAQDYKLPPRKARLWPDLPPAAATVITLVGINVAIFVLWRLPPLWKPMNRYFLVVPAYPHSISMLTACFSHQSFAHLLSNTVFLWLIGTRVHDDIGRGPFLALYFSSAVVVAYIPMVIYVMKNFLGTSTLGASGVASALIGTYCVLHEGRIITFDFLPPEWTRGVDTGILLAILMLLEVANLHKWGIVPTKLLNTGRPHIDYMGHLSGYLTGIGAGAIIRSTDPKWKNAERNHFFAKDFGKK